MSHTDYLDEIDLGFEKVVSMHEASPEYIDPRFQGMMGFYEAWHCKLGVKWNWRWRV